MSSKYWEQRLALEESCIQHLKFTVLMGKTEETIKTMRSTIVRPSVTF